MSSHLERRLAIQLADKSTDELVSLIARQQVKLSAFEGAPQVREDGKLRPMTMTEIKAELEDLRNQVGRRDDVINETPGRTEIELQERLALAYYGADRGRGLTIDEMITEMEKDGNTLGYPIKEHIRRFNNSGARRQR